MAGRAYERKIPIIVGVTAHRSIRESDRGALFESVKAELSKLQARCPNSPLILLTSLAEGGDQLCAEAAVSVGIPLIVALPMERGRFVRDFDPESLACFDRLCADAIQMFVTPFTEAVPASGADNDFLYRQAGIYIAAHSHLMLARWDGGPGTEAACGTSEAVDFSLRGSYSPARGGALRSGSNTAVLHIYTPRRDRCDEPAGAVHLLGNKTSLDDTLTKTEDFNRLTADIEFRESSHLPEMPETGTALWRMDQVSLAAGRLSRRYAGIYRKLLARLAVASTVLTLAFLLYDEAEATWMILICGAMLAAAMVFQFIAKRSDCLRRYVEYRSLAECLRVESFLYYAGSRVRASELLPWTEQAETVWVLNALCAFEIGPEPESAHDIRRCWVGSQRDYHISARKKAARDLLLSERVVHTALLLSVLLYLSAVGFELLCGGLIFRPGIHVDNVELFRTVLKILLGVFSAATLFISNYYGKLSLERKQSDHEKMARFYAVMADQLDWRGQEEALLEQIAREELIENGNWCSYQRDNTPDFSL